MKGLFVSLLGHAALVVSLRGPPAVVRDLPRALDLSFVESGVRKAAGGERARVRAAAAVHASSASSPPSMEVGASAGDERAQVRAIAAAGEASAPPSMEVAAAGVVESRPAPHYPEEALDQGWEGDVLIQVRTDALGAVAEVLLVQSSGQAVLDEEALAVVRTWRLQPLKILRVPIRFRLS